MTVVIPNHWRYVEGKAIMPVIPTTVITISYCHGYPSSGDYHISHCHSSPLFPQS